MKKCVIPYSGGLDSTCMLYKAFFDNVYNEIHCITYDYGQKNKIEMDCAKWNVEYLNSQNSITKVFHKIINIDFMRDIAPTSCLTNDDIEVPDGSDISKDKQPSSYVPNRNMILLSIAASYAESVGAEEVYHGAVAADLEGGYWDCTPDFFENLNKTFAVSNGETKIRIATPLVNMTKEEIILQGLNYDVDFTHTWTDYSGGLTGIIANGKFIPNVMFSKLSDEQLILAADANSANSKCRLEGFAKAGVIDPLQYQQDLTEFWEKYNCIPIDELKVNDIKNKIKAIAMKNNLIVSDNIEKNAKAKLRFFGVQNWRKCPCIQDGKHACLSEACIEQIEKNGKCHCNLFLKK